VFYREAGSAHAPVLLLLHGFPASSFMYRDLISRLSNRFRVIAPDYPGFGYSDAPPANDFAYTFDHLADIIEKFTRRVGAEKYSIYMQDFGGPVGFRLATRAPQQVTSLIIQNANAYEEGLPDGFWTTARRLWQDPSTANYDQLRDAALSDEALEWNYTHGVKSSEAINPDSWVLQRALLNRPGNKDAMLALLYDYRTNLGRYSEWHEYFREHQPPTLIVWGANDVIFPAPGARAYLQDVYDHALRVLEGIDLNRDILTSIMDAQLSVQSNRLNEVMKNMTSLATILMMMALITGVYGMNFEHMPELHWKYGYLYVHVALLLVFFGGLTIASKIGWFTIKWPWEHRDRD
jgi:pimeloyl-ACP methyl ester carboxylesterase